MKKRDLKKLALLGICAGSLIAKDPLTAADASPQTTADQKIKENNESNMNYHLMTEDELLLELSPEGEALYNSLDSEGKKLARQVASQYCNYTNLCKGLNACKTDTNECAGRGPCKALGKCAFSDKNLAIKVVVEKMKEKRKALAK